MNLARQQNMVTVVCRVLLPWQRDLEEMYERLSRHSVVQEWRVGLLPGAWLQEI